MAEPSPSTSAAASSSLPTTSPTAQQGKGRKRPHHNSRNNWESRRGRPRRHFNNRRNTANNNNINNRGAPPGAKKQDTPPPSCSVCKLVSTDTICANKYKCPKCREPYCSVACYKQHKEICPATAEAANKTESSSPTAASSIENSGSNSKYLLSRDGDNYIVEDPLGLVTTNQTQQGSNVGDRQGVKEQQQQIEESDDDDDSLDEGWKITDSMKKTLDKSNWLHSELHDGGLRQIIHKIVHSSNIIQNNGRTIQEEELERAKASYPNFELFMDKLLVLAGVLERQRTMVEGDANDGVGTTANNGGVGSGSGGGHDTIDNANEEELEEWLKEDHTYEELQQMLVLKPLERKRPPKMTERIKGSSSSSSNNNGSGSSSSEDESSSDDGDDDDGSDKTDSSDDE